MPKGSNRRKSGKSVNKPSRVKRKASKKMKEAVEARSLNREAREVESDEEVGKEEFERENP